MSDPIKTAVSPCGRFKVALFDAPLDITPEILMKVASEHSRDGWVFSGVTLASNMNWFFFQKVSTPNG